MKILISVLIPLLVSIQSLAYLEFNESGELVPENQYRLGFAPQIGLSPSMVNFGAFFDTGIGESSQLRVTAGLGDTDFFAGFGYKMVPVPDYQKQPALGFKIGASFAREKDDNILTLQVSPFLSKIMDMEFGKLIPYAALQMGVSAHRSSSTSPTILALGSEILPQQFRKVQFGAELGLDLHDAISYITGYITFMFDDNEGPRFE